MYFAMNETGMDDMEYEKRKTLEQPAPKKRGRPKKTSNTDDANKTEPKTKKTRADITTEPDKSVTNTDGNGPVNGGGWSTPNTPNIPMTYMTVEVEFLEKALGTLPSNQELLSEYIASKAPDAQSREEEIAAIGVDEAFNKTVNIYPKGDFIYDVEHDRYLDFLDRNQDTQDILASIQEGDDNFVKMEKVPYLYNYQLRGFFKDSCGLMSRADGVDPDTGKKIPASESSKLKAYRKTIDGGIFVFPRRVAIHIPDYYVDDDGVTIVPTYDENGNLKILQRAIRISGPSGERTAIAASEMIPAGSKMKFTIGMTSPKFKPAVIEWLNYASVHGISGWRNSGLGICRWREIKPDYTPYE